MVFQHTCDSCRIGKLCQSGPNSIQGALNASICRRKDCDEMIWVVKIACQICAVQETQQRGILTASF